MTLRIIVSLAQLPPCLFRISMFMTDYIYLTWCVIAFLDVLSVVKRIYTNECFYSMKNTKMEGKLFSYLQLITELDLCLKHEASLEIRSNGAL